MTRGKGMDLIELMRRKVYTPLGEAGTKSRISFILKDKTVGCTVDHSGLQGPPGSSLLWSITQI